jgi:hypothetical protein
LGGGAGSATIISLRPFPWGIGMGVLMITCPVTGKQFSTGLQIEEKDVAALPDYETATLCPYCKQFHRWRPADASWLDALPPSDWIENQ